MYWNDAVALLNKYIHLLLILYLVISILKNKKRKHLPKNVPFGEVRLSVTMPSVSWPSPATGCCCWESSGWPSKEMSSRFSAQSTRCWSFLVAVYPTRPPGVAVFIKLIECVHSCRRGGRRWQVQCALIHTCPRAAVDLDPHAGGARMVAVGQEADPLGNQRMVQLLDNGQPRVSVARQNLIHQKSHPSTSRPLLLLGFRPAVIQFAR